MLNLNEFSHNHHPSRVNLLAKYIRRGFSVLHIFPVAVIITACHYHSSQPSAGRNPAGSI